MRVLSPLSVASLAFIAAAAVGSSASAQPMRKEGLWENKIQMMVPAPVTVTTKQCTDASQERAGAMFKNQQSAHGVECHGAPPVPAPGGGWSYSQTCTMRSMTMATTGTVRGDFNSGYHMESTTHMSPAPMPSMAETHMVMDARYLGPCPSDWKPGDVEMNGRRVSTRQ